jgi:hypothetical protein
MTATQSNNRLAVLIDADNAQPSVIEGLLAEVAKLGVASVKRIYGDWTSTGTTQWKQSLLRYSITPVQQFAYTKGKNATDASLIIDAMDLMHTHRFGEKKTPDAFVAACDKFIYTEVLRPASAEVAVVPPEAPSPPKRKEAPDSANAVEPVTPVAPSKPAEPPQVPLDLIRQAIEEESDESGWAHLGAVGSYIQRIRADFDVRLYGSKKLSELLGKYPKHFAIEERSAPGSSIKAVFVRKPPR